MLMCAQSSRNSACASASRSPAARASVIACSHQSIASRLRPCAWRTAPYHAESCARVAAPVPDSVELVEAAQAAAQPPDRLRVTAEPLRDPRLLQTQLRVVHRVVGAHPAGRPIRLACAVVDADLIAHVAERFRDQRDLDRIERRRRGAPTPARVRAARPPRRWRSRRAPARPRRARTATIPRADRRGRSAATGARHAPPAVRTTPRAPRPLVRATCGACRTRVLRTRPRAAARSGSAAGPDRRRRAARRARWSPTSSSTTAASNGSSNA